MAGLKFARTFYLPLKKPRNPPLLTLSPPVSLLTSGVLAAPRVGREFAFARFILKIIIVIIISTFVTIVSIIIINMMASRRLSARFSLSSQKRWQACLTRYLMIINNDINNYNNDNNNCIDAKSLPDKVFNDNQ